MALVGYELEKSKIEEKIREIRAKMGRGPEAAAAEAASPAPKRRKFSKAARRRMAAAQKKRWAEARKPKAA